MENFTYFCSLNIGFQHSFNLSMFVIFAIVGLSIIIINIICLILYFKYKEKNSWKFSDFDMLIILSYDIICGFIYFLVCFTFCFTIDHVKAKILCLFLHCTIIHVILDLSKYIFFTSIERLISIKFKKQMKLIKINQHNRIRLKWTRICFRLFFSFAFLIFSFSPMIFEWNEYETCLVLKIFTDEYILIGAITIVILIVSTIFFYLFIYLYLAKEKKRKIHINKQKNENLKKKMKRLNLLKKQTVFFITFSLVFLPFISFAVYQTLTFPSLFIYDSFSPFIIINYILILLSMLFFNIEPVMYFWTIRSLK